MEFLILIKHLIKAGVLDGNLQYGTAFGGSKARHFLVLASSIV